MLRLRDYKVTTDNKFVHLHVHTEYSLLDGAGRTEDYFKKAAEDGMPALATTDHGNLYAIPSMLKFGEKYNVKAIPGCEIYLEPEIMGLDRRSISGMNKTAKETGDDSATGKRYFHQTMLARNLEGYYNLIKMQSSSWMDNFYYKPLTSLEMLDQYSKGLMATSSCLGGVTLQHLMKGNRAEAEAYVAAMVDIFGADNFFIELQRHGIAEQEQTNPILLEIAKKFNLRAIATNDCHYNNCEDHKPHDALLCLQTGAKIHHEDRFKFSGDEGAHALKTSDEMRALFKFDPSLCDNTLWVAEQCEKIPFGSDKFRMPKFPVPEGYASEEEYLKWVVVKGAEHRWGTPTSQQKARLEYEIGIINSMGFAGYFLVLWDLCLFARTNKIRVGAGRGCLTKSTVVRTKRGYVPLPEVKLGDEVITHKGRWRPVLNVQSYPCDENLIKIDCWGQASGNTMTSDHKVYVSVAQPNPKAYEKNAKFLEKTAEDLAPPEWVEAKDVKIGDFVAVPIPASPGISESVSNIDLADYVRSCPFPERYKVGDTYIEERVPVNSTYPFSKREVSKSIKMSRNVINNVLDGTSRKSSKSLLSKHLKDNGFSLAEWKKYTTENSHRTTRINRYINMESDAFLTFLGAFVGDGWLRRDRGAVSLCDKASDESGRDELFDKIFGVTASEYIHNTKDLVQWTVESNLLSVFMRSLLPNYEYTAQTKHLPDWTSNLTQEQKMTLLQGLWDADGHRGKNRWTYSTSSYRLAHQVRELLWSNEIRASLKVDDRQDPREEYAKSSISYIVQAPREFINPSATYIISDGNHMWHRVRSITSRSAEQVYDIEVAEDNSYLTDSYVVHNSAAGSAVAYCCMITDIDPLEYDLLFERFLNPDRISMPDIDLDFDTRRRDDLIKYTAHKYGSDKVAQVITYGRIQARSAIKDAARVMDKDFAVGNAINAALPEPIHGRQATLEVCMAEEAPEGWKDHWPQAQKIRDLYYEDPEAKEVITTALGLEGLVRSTGVHAAAVIIGDDDLTNYLPIQQRQGVTTSQWDMHAVEDLGLVKMDYLGLRNLDVISDTIDIIYQTKKRVIKINEIPLDDRTTFEMLCAGKGIGVFQFENSGMRSFMRELQPDSIHDLAAQTALYRPGPLDMKMHERFVRRKRGEEKITYPHPDAEPILKDTLGILTYQESVMRIAQVFAGYSLPDADNLRRIVGKKYVDEMKKEKEKFLAGCVSNGYSKQIGQLWWDLIEPFASYGFNRSHAYSYAMISYQTAYLKANFSAEYFSALLNSVHEIEKAGGYIVEARSMGLDIKAPDINKSKSKFYPERNVIYVGFSAIKGIGDGPSDAIVQARQINGPFVDFMDFIKRGPKAAKNKKVVEGLIKSGAFDEMHPRGGLLDCYEAALVSDRSDSKYRNAGIVSISESMGVQDLGTITVPDRHLEKDVRLKLEKECLGTYVSEHPLDGMAEQLEKEADFTAEQIAETDGSLIGKICGVATVVVEKRTRKGDMMGWVTIEDLTGAVEVLVFPRTWAKMKILEGDIVTIKGNKDAGENKFKAQWVSPVKVQSVETKSSANLPVVLVKLKTDSVGSLKQEQVESLKKVFAKAKGGHRVYLKGFDDDTMIDLGDNYLITPSPLHIVALQRLDFVESVTPNLRLY